MNYNSNLIKHDLTIWLTIVIISNFINSNFKNKNLFNIDWFYYSIFFLFGLSIHSLFTSRITVYIVNKYNIKNQNIIDALIDIIKWSTVYIINNILFTYFKNNEIIFDERWFKLYGGIILGYILFDLIVKKEISKINNDPDLLIDLFKSTISLFLGFFISEGYIHIDFIHNLSSVLFALIIYYIFVKKIIPSLLL